MLQVMDFISDIISEAANVASHPPHCFNVSKFGNALPFLTWNAKEQMMTALWNCIVLNVLGPAIWIDGFANLDIFQ